MILRRFPAVVLALVLLAGCTSTDDQPEQWNAEFYNQNAQRLFDGTHYNEALDQFQKALNVEPDSKVARLGRAWCLLFIGEGQIMGGVAEGAENVQLAREALTELKSVDYGDNKFKVTLGLGKAHVLMGDLYAARVDRLVSDATRRPVENAPTMEIKAAETSRDQEYAAGASLFRSVLSENSNPAARDNLTALIQLARVEVINGEYASSLLYSERYLDQVRRSKDLWVESIRRFPEDEAIWEVKLAGAVRKEVEVRDLIANTLFKLDRLEGAVTQLDQVILLDPDRGDAYLNRGIMLQMLGEKQRALEDFRRFMLLAAMVEIEASDGRVIEATKRLMRLEKELGLESTVPLPEKTPSENGV